MVEFEVAEDGRLISFAKLWGTTGFTEEAKLRHEEAGITFM